MHQIKIQFVHWHGSKKCQYSYITLTFNKNKPKLILITNFCFFVFFCREEEIVMENLRRRVGDNQLDKNFRRKEVEPTLNPNEDAAPLLSKVSEIDLFLKVNFKKS